MPGSQKLTPPSSATATCDDRVAIRVIASNRADDIPRAAGWDLSVPRSVLKFLIVLLPSAAANRNRRPQIAYRPPLVVDKIQKRAEGRSKARTPLNQRYNARSSGRFPGSAAPAQQKRIGAALGGGNDRVKETKYARRARMLLQPHTRSRKIGILRWRR
jgi:hypothetical protein